MQLTPSNALTVTGVGNVTTYFSTFNGTFGTLLINSQTGVVSGELRPRSTTAGLYEGGYAQATPLLIVDYGSYSVSIPTTDADGNGMPDLLQYDRDGNFTASGSGFSAATGLTFSISIRFVRSANSASGTYSATTQNSAGQTNSVSGPYQLLSYRGTMTYSRGGTNTMSVSVAGLFPGGVSLSGSTSFTTSSPDQLAYASFSIRDPSGVTYQVRAGSLSRSGNSYRGNLSLVDGLPQTGWADFTEYAFVVTDPNDSNNNGIPDLTDPASVPPTISTQPRSQSATAGQNVSLSVVAVGATSYQWAKNGVAIPNATTASLAFPSIQLVDAGSYTVVVTNDSGSANSIAAVLTVNSAPAAPVFTIQPLSFTSVRGTPVALVTDATGFPAPSFQWRKDGLTIPGATTRTLLLPSVNVTNAGTYTCVATNTVAAITSLPASLAVSETPDVGRLINLSIRTRAGAGVQTLITGFTVGGVNTVSPKALLVRGIGPSLSQFGVNAVLEDPLLQLFSGSVSLGSNDDWGGTSDLKSLFAQLGAFAFSSDSSKDAAYYVSNLASGSYTAQISGNGGADGIALAEVYDATPPLSVGPTTPRLINVSTRAQVGTEAGILIAGFVVGGTTAKTLLIRGVGPTLSVFGVTGFLADPKLEILAGNRLLNANDDWNNDANLVGAASAVGAFPLGAASKDSALLLTLPPGNYTAQMSGVGNTTGVGLVELYEMPPARASTLPATLRLGLLAFFPFNGNAADVINSGSSASVQGAVLTTDRFGEAGAAYDFNGRNSAIFCTIPNLPIGTSSRSVSLWAKATPSTGNLVGLVEWGAAAVRQTFGISAQFSPLVYQAKSFGGGNDVSSGQIADNRWRHLVATFGDGALRIFVDGVLRGSSQIPINTGQGQVRIGVGVEGGNYFSGQLDDVRIYGRALSPSDVAELFQIESVGTALP